MLIGISGKVGSGKSFTAKYIMENLPEYKFKKKSYGYNVKKTVSFLTGVNMKIVVSRKAKNMYLPEWGMTFGQMFQKVGEGTRIELHPDVWIKSMYLNYSDRDNWLIDDVRYINEADFIKDNGGVIIRLEGDPKGVRSKDKRDSTHKSEIELDNYPRFDIIFNSEKENLDDLIESVKKLIKNKIK